MIFHTYEPGPPEVLWHYAGVETSRRILESRTLWASDTRRMSDVTEFSYPRKALADVVERLQVSSTSTYELWFEAIAAVIAGAEDGLTVYAACTSAAEDSTSQWEEFAEGGRGFAIGLNRQALYTAAAEQDYTLFPLIYDLAKQEEFLAGQCMEGAKELPGLEASMGRGPGMALVLGCAISFPMLYVKNPRKRSEAEWRLGRLETGLDDRPVSNVRGDGIRYETVNLDNPRTGESSIAEVMIGPIASEESIEKIRKALDDVEPGNVSVSRSEL